MRTGPFTSMHAAASACYADYGEQGEADDPLRGLSGGPSWAVRQPAGTEVARLESGRVVYRIIRVGAASYAVASDEKGT